MRIGQVVEMFWEVVRSYLPGLDCEFLEQIVQGKASLDDLRVEDVDEDFAKALLIRRLVEERYRVHKEWSERKKFTIKGWVKQLRLTAVLTYHPTPFMVHSAWALDNAIRIMVVEEDVCSFGNAVRATFKLPMRNVEKPTAKTMVEFVLNVAEIFFMAIKVRLLKNWRLECWVVSDMDGNLARLAQEVLDATLNSQVANHLRENVRVVREVFARLFPDITPSQALTMNLSGAGVGDSRLEQVLSGLTSEHNVSQAVIADANDPDDVLSLAAIMKACGNMLPICPLLERFSRIVDWETKLRDLLRDQAFVQYVTTVEGKKVIRVQLGPSDTVAHAGFFSLCGIGHMILVFCRIAKEEGYEVILFIGPGTVPARGGGSNMSDLALTLPNLEGLVKEVKVTVQGGMAAAVFNSIKQVVYHLSGFMEALSLKAPHNPEQSLALFEFAKATTEAFQQHAERIRILLMRSDALGTIDAANLSDRELSRDESGKGLRAIAIQQLLALNGGEFLLCLGFLEVWKKTPEAAQKLLLSTDRFQWALSYALEAAILTENEILKIACDKAEFEEEYFDSIRLEIRASIEVIRSLLPTDKVRSITRKAKKKKGQVAVRRWMSKVGHNRLTISVRVLLMHYILLTLGRAG